MLHPRALPFPRCAPSCCCRPSGSAGLLSILQRPPTEPLNSFPYSPGGAAGSCALPLPTTPPPRRSPAAGLSCGRPWRRRAASRAGEQPSPSLPASPPCLSGSAGAAEWRPSHAARPSSSRSIVLPPADERPERPLEDMDASGGPKEDRRPAAASSTPALAPGASLPLGADKVCVSRRQLPLQQLMRHAAPQLPSRPHTQWWLTPYSCSSAGEKSCWQSKWRRCGQDCRPAARESRGPGNEAGSGRG